MHKTTMKILFASILVSTLVGCAAAPEDANESDQVSASAEPAAPAQEENIGKTQQDLVWSTPMCAYFQWKCGECICNACGVEDCRAVVFK